MAEKKYIDPSLKKRNENGTNLDSRAMSKRRGRKKKNEGGTTAKPVKSVDKHVRFSKEEFEGAKSFKFVDDNFAGSLPSFIAAFASIKKLSKKEVDEIQKMIDTFREEG